MNDLPMSLRTHAGEAHYAEQKTNNNLIPLADEASVLEYKHWRIIRNRFPYDAVLEEHDMLVPKRVVAERKDLTLEEARELTDILEEMKNSYDFVMENFPRKRSILYHYHLHLGRYKKQRSDINF